jgi:hypothetical protein
MNKHNVATLGMEPFGLHMGMSPEAVGAELEEIRPFVYHPLAVPRPYPAFYRYVVTITPQAGLAGISALGGRVPTSATGAELRSVFADLVAELAATYGSHLVIYSPERGYDRPAPRRWMRALGHAEYLLGAHRLAQQGSALGQALTSVTLDAGGIDNNAGYFSLDYVFANEAQADAEIEALRQRAR